MAKNATLEKLPNETSIKLLLTCMSDLKTEMHQIRYRLGLYTSDRSSQTPDPAGGDYSAPRPLGI